MQISRKREKYKKEGDLVKDTVENLSGREVGGEERTEGAGEIRQRREFKRC